MPLRVTLVAALLALVTLGLLASGVATTTYLKDFLVQRTDAQLGQDAGAFLHRMSAPVAPLNDPGAPRPPARYYVALVAADGTTLQVIDDPGLATAPDLTSIRPDSTAHGPVTVTSTTGGPQWRVVAEPVVLTDGSAASVVAATSLADVSSTVHRLVLLQTAIGLVVLLLLAVLGYLVVRRSLRPLVEVEETAAAIATGELDRRVPDLGQRTEVGRLSVALNGMLSQIQSAFDSAAASAQAAQSSEQRMRRFVGDASHELRTPLTTIRGFAELYRQGAATDPAAVQRLMSRIEDESARMGLLVEDLLLLARLDSQRPLEREPVDLLAVASDAVHAAQAVAPRRSIRLEVVDGPGTPEVLGDDSRLRQVLGNLVTNALVHTPPEAAVTVRVGTDAEHSVLEVSDTGPGLTTEAAERVFERFYRADSSRTRASGGTGLGLSIVAALVSAHRGTVRVDSAPGAGATFRVSLPRAPH
ncbi:HAMP domain-containing sensor histidine kinase [Rhodococcus sp. X156]|uniref:HAMP domain-containing sensor histidine kinase n=1 Tax=Rhodococcus sp. X156 TaxID=2499145 RepID=UPI000FDC1AC4|nr:HAMP domain-containing sensor histidine kinase [Rhodococcus sp. X156]